MSLRIAFVVDGFPVLSQTFISLQIGQLVKHGELVEVINFGKPGNYSMLPKVVRGDIESIKVSHAVSNSGKKLKNNIFFLLKALAFFSITRPKFAWFLVWKFLFNKEFKGFSRLIVSAYMLRHINDFDVVHCQFFVLADMVSTLHKCGFIKGNVCLVSSVRGFDLTKKKHIDANLLAEVFDSFSLFTPVCDSFSGQLRSLGYGGLIKTVRSPINVEAISAFQIAKKNTFPAIIRFVSVGRLVEKKGISDAVYALADLKNKGLCFVYKIVGSGPCYSEIKGLVSALNLNDSVEFLGSLPPDDVLSIIFDSDVMLVPSKKASDGDSEGIPNVLKEAMLMGVQVVSTYHSGIPELIQDGVDGHLCEEGNPDALSKKINSVLMMRSEWDEIRKKAQNTVLENYSPEITTSALLKAYYECLRVRDASGGKGVV